MWHLLSGLELEGFIVWGMQGSGCLLRASQPQLSCEGLKISEGDDKICASLLNKDRT